MKNIVVSVPNTLLSGGICMYLEREKDFFIMREDKLDQLTNTCLAAEAEVLLAEVRHYPPYSVEDWFKRAKGVKALLPHCKIAFIVDENSNPQTAEEVKEAKIHGLIDAFFHTTVSGEYLTAVVSSL